MTPVTHHPSHATLLRPLQPGKLPLGGIIVPATRPAAHLSTTLELGSALRVPVVVLCSGRTMPRDVVDLAEATDGAYCVAVDMVTMRSYEGLPKFETEEFPDGIIGSYGDLSLKRNLGLRIGRLAGWAALLFVDDDISGLSARMVRHAVGALRNHAAVGLRSTDYPDNSVVCHARRQFVGGERQDIFVSGSAMAVNLTASDTFFPPVYNEDWLFFAPLIDGYGVAKSGSVRQLPYYPFDSPERAGKQEFGDVLAEGLMGHLHGGSLDALPSKRYWGHFISARARLIEAAAAGCRKMISTSPAAKDAITALRSASEVLAKIDGDLLIDYVGAWQSDLLRWRDYRRRARPVHSLEKALAELGLLGSVLIGEGGLALDREVHRLDE